MLHPLLSNPVRQAATFENSASIILERSLNDIAENLSFDEDFNIFHPAYRTWSRDSKTVARIKLLTLQTQANHLRKHLQTYIYGMYYNQSQKHLLEFSTETTDRAGVVHQDELTIGMIQAELFQELHENNTSDGYQDPGWLVEKHEPDGAIAVLKNDFRLHVLPGLHLATNTPPPVGTEVSVLMPKNCFQSGFYVAVSNLGSPVPTTMTEDQTIVRVYFNLPVQIAPQLMNFLTDCLNGEGICFNYKSPCHPNNYLRSDAGVLYFLKQDYTKVHPLLERVFATFGDRLAETVPLFTKCIAPGIGVAEDPWQKIDPPYESFGLNRCAMIAIALLRLENLSALTPAVKKAEILSVFEEFSIDPCRPYLNPGATDIFHKLNKRLN